jgi:hypothetical protein
MGRKNPISARLELLSDQWEEFAVDERARLLCWLFQQDEQRMVDAFLASQGNDDANSLPDVFVELVSAFENYHGHGYTLYEELSTGYLASGDVLREQGIAADWQPAAFGARPSDDVHFLVERCQSFSAHYRLGRHLVLVLRPKVVTDAGAFDAWLQRLVRESPPNLRVLVIDSAEAPARATLAQSEPVRVRVQLAALDMPTALEEISRDGGNLETPGGQFRHLFVKMGNALRKQDTPLALQLGTAAISLATSQRWWYAVVPVHFALAGGLSLAGRLEEAIGQFRAGEAAAVQGETDGPEEARAACKTMRLQARLGCGSTLISAAAWSAAAQVYEGAVPLAVDLGDQAVLLDCHRLASFCHEQAGNAERAFSTGMDGLEVARRMDKQALETSTFPYLGEGLMRTSAPRGVSPQVEREIVLVAGTPDWRPKPGAASARS